MRRAVTGVVAPCVVLVGLTGCGSRDPSERGISVANALVGEAPAGADAALYLDLTSATDDALIAVETEVAAATTLHELEEVDGGGIMWPVDRIELAAGATAELRPFGSHVMLEDLVGDLVPGESLMATLVFERHAPVEIAADVVALYELSERYPADDR